VVSFSVEETILGDFISDMGRNGEVKRVVRESELNFDVFNFLGTNCYWALHKFGMYYYNILQPNLNISKIIMNDNDESGIIIYINDPQLYK
jgi:hypothetical protein